MLCIQVIDYMAERIRQSSFQATASICTKENSYSYSYNKDKQQSIFRNTLRLFIEITGLHVLNDFKHKYSSLNIDTVW